MKLPKKITPCPIIDIAVEIRFDSDLLPDAIFGIVYNSIRSEYPNTVEKLPILQLPDEVRLNDPNLKFQPYYRLANNTFIVQIGPKMLSLGSHEEYIGWKVLFPKLMGTFQMLKGLGIVKIVNRLGIRYINFFDFNIFEKINLKIAYNDDQLKSDHIVLNTDIVDDNFTNRLLIANRVNIPTTGRVGSIIDIDTHIDDQMENFFDQMQLLLQQAHEVEKKLFFSLIKKEYLQTLSPEY